MVVAAWLKNRNRSYDPTHGSASSAPLTWWRKALDNTEPNRRNPSDKLKVRPRSGTNSKDSHYAWKVRYDCEPTAVGGFKISNKWRSFRQPMLRIHPLWLEFAAVKQVRVGLADRLQFGVAPFAEALGNDLD